MTLVEEYYDHILENVDYGETKNSVFQILKDMTGRRGLSQEWDQIDEEIQEEIIEEWISIIEKNLK